jgi:hypothetical protein
MATTTPRYGLTYPTGYDQVADTPTIFKNMADSVENALGEVDDRHTNAAVMPVVRPSLMQLQQATAITGQIGFVTSDGDNTGPYIWDGTSWHHAHWYASDDKAKTTLVDQSGWKCEYMIKHGFVYVTVNLSDSGTKGWSVSQMPGTLPEEARPPLELNFAPMCSNNTSIGVFIVKPTGVIVYSRRGGGQISDNRYATMMWPAE